MTDTTSAGPNANPGAMLWNEQWLAAQRGYWEAWQDMLKAQPGAAANPWSQALENWWRAVSGTAAGDSQGVLARMMDQGRIFFGLAQQMNELFHATTESGTAGGKWQDVLKQRFDAMKSSLSMHEDSEWAQSMKRMAAFYEMPLDTWRRMCSGASMMPGDFLQVFRSQVFEGIGDKLHGNVDKFLSVPGVGYTRESQEQMQEMAKLLIDYQKAAQEYLNAHTKLGADALDHLYRKILALAEKGEKVTSLRQLYDLWVDASEEVYGDFAMSTAFQDLYSRMVNALMRVKLHARTMVDEVLSDFNMPTRREMNTILKRQHELKRQMRVWQRSMDDSTPPPRGKRNGGDKDTPDLGALRNELAALREQVSALQAQSDKESVPMMISASLPAASPPKVAPSAHKPRKTPAQPAVKAEAPERAERAPRPTESDWDIGSIVKDAPVRRGS